MILFLYQFRLYLQQEKENFVTKTRTYHMAKSENIHPVFDKILNREHKEQLISQKGITIWMTGLSGSGKTTVAIGLERKLHALGILTQVLDGDNVRTGINNNLGFSETDRHENIRRIAEVSKLFINCGIVTINCFVSPTIAMRQAAREIIGSKNFVEVYVNASLNVCEKRDVKGLYAKARKGEIKNFTGIDAPFEAPIKPEIIAETGKLTVEETVDYVFGQVISRIKPTE